MQRLGPWIVGALALMGVCVIVTLVIATGLGAVTRYLHLANFSWSFELTGMLFIWCTVIGAILAEIAGENVSVDGNTVTSQRGRSMRLYHNAILLMVGAALAWSGVAMLGRTAFVPTPVMRAPSWIVHSSIVFLGASLGVIAVLRILRLVR